MIEGLLNALSGLRMAGRRLQTSAHNVANVQTSGFKKGIGYLTAPAAGPSVTGNPGGDGFGSVLSGFRELSNVDIAGEILGQIVSKQAFHANADVIKAADDMTGTILDIKG